MTVLTEALADPRSSVRLQAVMAAGTTPDTEDLDVLVAQCATEPDFFVRDMLTWALTRHPADAVVARVLPELDRPEPQARSQALHTLSKIGDPEAWPAVRPLLGDRDDEVLRAAWRTAVALVPDEERASLARTLAVQLGVGDRDRRLSLSRALAGLGEDTVAPVLAAAADRGTDAVREHVRETERLLHDPGAASELALERARREVALGRTRSVKG
ncbi:HEAT repeat domain-containing protein [Curtobacterium oceanosedimentum]|uniref:HEAT repeat domain-containing protein n=1 Tax=Curtobacterium oceanosedimentum TaxID=465820 RepID=UPI001CE0E553|nr:HEAT repeat domain-containing protein [Curtobacterium oceanosedimentum]MCA5922304.1 HEAT repeat domain-containing protein [Curtobacterium oceanosedimentum]